jgi:propionate CoA-transferase
MKFISAVDAASLVFDGDAVLISGSGGGHSVPEALLAALGERFKNEGSPKELTAISVVGVGDRISLGADHFGQKGMTRRSITSALVDSPALMRMAANNEIESYTLGDPA